MISLANIIIHPLHSGLVMPSYAHFYSQQLSLRSYTNMFQLPYMSLHLTTGTVKSHFLDLIRKKLVMILI